MFNFLLFLGTDQKIDYFLRQKLRDYHLLIILLDFFLDLFYFDDSYIFRGKKLKSSTVCATVIGSEIPQTVRGNPKTGRVESH